MTRTSHENRRHHTAFMAVLIVIASVLLAGCDTAATPPAERVVLIGIDGADWKVIDRLIEDGRLPHLARMKSEGASGELRSHEPVFSPVVWATISTGKMPESHGIRSFTAPLVVDGDTVRVPVTSNMLRASRVWEILGRRGRSVGSVGWWTTWPARPVENGFVISERTWPLVMGENGWPVTSDGASEVSGRTYPESLFEQVEPLIVTRDTFSPEDLDRLDLRGPLAQLGTSGPSTADMYAKDLTFLRIATELRRTIDPAFFTVYLELPDVMSHYFWDAWRYYRFAEHGESTEFRDPPRGLTSQGAIYAGRLFERAYELADEAVGQFLATADGKTLVLVVSDHGYGENSDRRELRVGDDLHSAVPHWHVLDGVLLAWGHGVKRESSVEGAGVSDITPTILYAMGEPVGADMDGRVLSSLFDGAFARRAAEYVPTHDPGDLGDGEGPLPSPDTDAMREVLRSLGYIK